MLDFLKRLRARDTAADATNPAPRAIDASRFERLATDLEFLHGLDAEELARLRHLVDEFLTAKELFGARGFELTDDICLAIAMQACLPVLNLGLGAYDGFVGIIVYPGEFRVNRTEIDEDGVVHEWADELSGEAWEGGPVVLSWQDVDAAAAGYNVVIHEFAHKLDMVSGEPDGYPPAPAGIDPRAWRTGLDAAYTAFCDEVDEAERATASAADTLDFDFDPYAAEHPAEFFAVMSEAFFTEPNHLRERYPALYDLLARFYRQDPARRLTT